MLPASFDHVGYHARVQSQLGQERQRQRRRMAAAASMEGEDGEGYGLFNAKVRDGSARWIVVDALESSNQPASSKSHHTTTNIALEPHLDSNFNQSPPRTKHRQTQAHPALTTLLWLGIAFLIGLQARKTRAHGGHHGRGPAHSCGGPASTLLLGSVQRGMGGCHVEKGDGEGHYVSAADV